MTIVDPQRLSIVTRRRLLTKGAVLGGGALALASGAFPAIAAAHKMSQSAASYQPRPKGAARCDACALFQKPDACQTVAGAISPSGWCILFAPK